MKHDIYAPSDPSLAPGEARCPGPSVQDLYARTGEGVPQPLQQQRYEFLGDQDESLERYTSSTVFDAEVDRDCGAVPGSGRAARSTCRNRAIIRSTMLRTTR